MKDKLQLTKPFWLPDAIPTQLGWEDSSGNLIIAIPGLATELGLINTTKDVMNDAPKKSSSKKKVTKS